MNYNAQISPLQVIASTNYQTENNNSEKEKQVPRGVQRSVLNYFDCNLLILYLLIDLLMF